jgi:hypothetical protein
MSLLCCQLREITLSLHGKILKFILLRMENAPLPLERKDLWFILYIIENVASYFDIFKISCRTAAGHHSGQRVVPAVGAGRLGDPHHGLHLLSFHDCHAALIQVTSAA